MAWFNIGDVEDFPVGEGREQIVDDRVIAVLNVDGELFAMDGICPHQGGPLGKGYLDGCILTCPWHGQPFDVRDGQSKLTPEVLHPTFETKTENGCVWVFVKPNQVAAADG